jgi:SPP1 gp7 family putative phage head morphogenesis protein
LGTTKGDPTRTLTIRTRFIKDLTKRFNLLAREIEKAIIINDVFGLRNPTGLQSRPRQFAFTRDADKLRAFMDWLEIEEERFIFSGGAAGIQTIGRQGSNWTDTYIRSAYQRGIGRARSELKKAGADVPTAFGKDAGGEIIAAFNQPIHIDRAQFAFTRTWTGLQTVVNRMNGELSRTLAQGLVEGRNPNELAKDLTDFIKGKNLNDAKTLARTEVIRAHHSATIAEYRRAGVEGVKVRAEWFTAGDNRVCPACEALEGQIFTLDEIEGLIPLHPNCRCIALPVVDV